MSKPNKSRSRQLSRAQLKAYEARRSAEVNRDGVETTAREATAVRKATAAAPRRIQPLSRAQEYAIIRSDLNRLLWILAVLAVMLVVMTFILR